MPSHPPPPIVSPFQAILTWSSTLPVWQRDALRRIVLNGNVIAQDVDELEQLCKAQHGLTSPGAAIISASVLTADHIPGGPDASSSISLVRLEAVTNVGALEHGQTIRFGDGPGLTIVYGENGSGKSGYCRVLKKACRARGAVQEIRANAFDSKAVGPAKATIVFRHGTVETTFEWTDGSHGDIRLSNVYVFDSISARFHVSEDGPASFTPRGLDILPKLARTCDEIKSRLKSESEALSRSITQSQSDWKYKPTTVVGKLLAGLTAKTTEQDVVRHATFSDTDRKRLAALADVLKTDAKQKAAATRAAAARLKEFGEHVQKRSAVLDDPSLAVIREALALRTATADAAKATARDNFEDGFLPGTGGGAWRQLWETARKFSSTVAYPQRNFPVMGADARCLLCQGPLGEEESARLARFDAYVRDEIRSRAEAAEANVGTIARDMGTAASLAADYTKVTADVSVEGEAIRSTIDTFVQQADERLAQVQACLNTGVWSDPPPLGPCPTATIQTIIEGLSARADMEQSADDPATRQQLTTERDELEDREWLWRNKQTIVDHLARLSRIALLKQCQDDTATNAITIKSGELADALVTTAYCRQFETECAALHLTTLPIKLEPIKGTKGELRFGMRFSNACTTKVGDIASEGEHRSAALAAFLAELSQASHKSALVFDDPVSSLDHKRRAAIAQRLVTEAKSRQVIVFTHDLSFVCDLQSFADMEHLDIQGQWLELSATKNPGRCHDELPWEGQKYKAQMKTLRDECGKAAKSHREKGESEYRVAAAGVTDLIRATAERLIEEVLFNHVLRRHESRIQVGRLESVGAVEPGDYQEVHRIWKACSELTPSHFASRARMPNAPDPTKRNEYVEALDRVVQKVRQRRTGTSPKSDTAINYTLVAADAPVMYASGQDTGTTSPSD